MPEHRPYGPGEVPPFESGVARREPVRHNGIPRSPGYSEDRSLGELFGDLSKETRTLVRQEIDLARLEVRQRAQIAGKSAGIIGAGGAIAYVGLMALAGAVIALLATFMPVWVSSLLVGAALAGGGYLLINQGIDRFKKTDFSLTKTTDTLKEDKQWLKEEMK